MTRRVVPLVLLAIAALAPQAASAQKAYEQKARYDEMVARHARANGVPESLVHRVIVRESKYQPHLIGRGGAMGMMQIKLPTARGVGYTGSAEGLLDAETNMTYAVKYLAGAYRVAGGDHDRTVSYYARGYYYAAKRQNMLPGATPQILMAQNRGPQILVQRETRRHKRATPFIAPPRMDELTSASVSPAAP